MPLHVAYSSGMNKNKKKSLAEFREFFLDNTK